MCAVQLVTAHMFSKCISMCAVKLVTAHMLFQERQELYLYKRNKKK